MANKDGWNKCSICGKYVSIADMDNGNAFIEGHQEVYNVYDGDIRLDEWTEVLCPKCYEKEKQIKKL
jgi:hypothetical protein